MIDVVIDEIFGKLAEEVEKAKKPQEGDDGKHHNPRG